MTYVKKANPNSDDETLRDERGRWLPGTPATNPAGRPSREVEEVALMALRLVWSPEALHDVATTLLAYAKAGNIAAATLILKYAVGNLPDYTGPNSNQSGVLGDLSDTQIDIILATHRNESPKMLDVGNFEDDNAD